MKTAIILAAGIGSRLRPLTETLPKCCVTIGGTSLIRRIVSQLQALEPEMPVFIVTGYLGDVVQRELADYGGHIRFINNANYATTNNMESCRMALDARAENGASLILNADCVYDEAIVAQIVRTQESAIAVDTGVYIDESMKVRVEDGLVRSISKSIAKSQGVATSIDLYSFEAADINQLLKIMKGYYNAGNLNQWTEVAIADLVRDSAVRAVDIAGKRWIEIDDSDDLRRAQKLFSA